MGLKKITLADTKTVMEDGQPKLVKENEKTYLTNFTNKALKYGLDNGFFKTTNVRELFVDAEEDIKLAWKVIYVSLVGANEGIDKELSFEEFIDKLDVPVDEVAYLSQSIIQPNLPETFKEYVEEVSRLTEKTEKKH